MLLERELSHNIEPLLEPGERVLWEAQPDPVTMAIRDWPFSVIGIFLVGVVLTWTFHWFGLGGPVRHVSIGTAIVNGLINAAFCIVPILMAASPVFSYRSAIATDYAITNRRVLVVTQGRAKRRIAEYSKDELGRVKSVEREDGSGDLTFAQTIPFGKRSTAATDIQFVAIKRVCEVESLLRSTFDIAK